MLIAAIVKESYVTIVKRKKVKKYKKLGVL
jgi:hypothetical protein